MSMKTGRAASITARDLEMLRALAFCPMLTELQIMRLDLPGPENVSVKHARQKNYSVPERGFASHHSVRRRLYTLATKGYVIPHKASHYHPTMWRLTAEGHKNVVGDRLWLEQTHDIDLPFNDYKPEPLRANHHHSVSDIFVSIQPLLTGLFGTLPCWDWKSERRAYYRYPRGSTSQAYMPDAEIILGDEQFLISIERQTKDARATSAEIAKKVEDHADCLSVVRQLDPEEYLILFSCDEPRDAAVALQTGRNLGVPVVAEAQPIAIHHIYELAHKHAKARPRNATYETDSNAGSKEFTNNYRSERDHINNSSPARSHKLDAEFDTDEPMPF